MNNNFESSCVMSDESDSENDGEVMMDRAQRHRGTAVIFLVTLEPILRYTHTHTHDFHIIQKTHLIIDLTRVLFIKKKE